MRGSARMGGGGWGLGGEVGWGAWRGALENAEMQDEIIFPDSRDPIGRKKMQTLNIRKTAYKEHHYICECPSL